MTDTAELAAAIAAVKRVTPAADPWTAEDIWSGDYEPSDIDRSIATILNAVASGDLAEVIALRAEVERLRSVLSLTVHADDLREIYHRLPNARNRIGDKRSQKSRAKDLWLRAFRRAAKKAHSALQRKEEKS